MADSDLPPIPAQEPDRPCLGGCGQLLLAAAWDAVQGHCSACWNRERAMAAAFRSAEFWECEICGDCWVEFMTTRFYPRSPNPLRWLARRRGHWHGRARRLSRNYPDV